MDGSYNLSVEILGARDLIAVDSDGYSDPFVTVQLTSSGKPYPKPWHKVRSTREKRKTLSPVYGPDDKNTFVYSGLTGPLPTLRVRVMDWNRVMPAKPMGEVDVEVGRGDSLAKSQPQWYALQPPSERSIFTTSKLAWESASLGEVEIRFSIKKREDVATNHAAWNFPDEDDASKPPNVLRVAVVSARLVAEQRPKSFRGAPTASMRGNKTSCNPKAVVRYRDLKRSTKILRRTLNPNWAATFDLARLDDKGSDNFFVEVLDSRGNLLESKRIGKVTINCSKSDVTPRDYDLDNNKGSVCLAWKLAYDSSYDDSSTRDWFPSDRQSVEDDCGEGEGTSESSPDEVHVVVVRAQGLRAADFAFFGKNATSDPYVKLRAVLEEEDEDDDEEPIYWSRTEVVKTTLSPVWNARFALRLPGGRRRPVHKRCKLCLEVYDHDIFTADDFLGRASIPLPSTAEEERARQSTAEWIPLEGENATGEILVAYKTARTRRRRSISVSENDAVEMLTLRAALPAIPAPTPSSRPSRSWTPFDAAEDDESKIPNELRVGLKRARSVRLGANLDCAATVVFSVIRKGSNGGALLEWQSKQAKFVSEGLNNEEKFEASFRQPFVWPLTPSHRDDDCTLSAKLSYAGSQIPCEATLSGSVSLTTVASDRTKIHVIDLVLRGDDTDDEMGVLEIVCQWRHNRYLVETPPVEEAQSPKEEDVADEDIVRIPKREKKFLRDIVRRRIMAVAKFRTWLNSNLGALDSYAAFVPAMVLREISKRREEKSFESSLNLSDPRVHSNQIYGRAMRCETKTDAAVLFADISGFTKLTEKLNQRLNGAELLCSELDVVYGALCEEADVLGGDAVKFAGDAICFVWAVEDSERGGKDLSEATRRAALCAHRQHARIRRHPYVEGVKLTLHVGISAGPLTCLSITRARPAGQRQRSEFIVAGPPLERISIAEPLAGPGETVCSPEVWEHVKDYFVGSEPNFRKHPALREKAVGYVKLDELLDEEEDVVDAPKMSLMASTVELLKPYDVELIAPFVPRAFERILRDKHATATFVEHGKHSKAEIRELTVAFCSFHGLDVAREPQRTEDLVSCVDWAVRNYDGSINKFIVDDKGTLAVIVFGLPTSVHENAATRCLAAIRLLQENLPALSMSCWVGVTTAKTFCGAVGSRRRMEYTVMGDSVNVAARLMNACDIISRGQRKNAVIVANSTRRATADEIEYDELDPIEVKGKSHPVSIFSPRSWSSAAKGSTNRRPHSIRMVSTALPAMTKGLDNFESHRSKIRELQAIFDKFLSRSESSQVVSTCVVRAVGGMSAAFDLGQHVPAMCDKRNIRLFRVLPSQSIYHDGVLKATTLCGAWRGPFISALDLIASSSSEAARPSPFGSGLRGREHELSQIFPNDVETISCMFLKDEAPDPALLSVLLRDEDSSVIPAAFLDVEDPHQSMWHSSVKRLVPVPEDEESVVRIVSARQVEETTPAPPPMQARRMLPSRQLAKLVVEAILGAARISPLCIMLDNLSQMDDTSWEVVDILSRGYVPSKDFSGSGDSIGVADVEDDDADNSSAHPVLLCMLAPLTRDEGVHRAEWSHVRERAKRDRTLVEVSPLEPDEALVFAAEVLGLCRTTDSEEQRQAAGARLKDVPQLAEYIQEARGVRDILCAMLEDAVARGKIEVTDQNVVLEKAKDGSLVALPPPQDHAGIALAAIDDALAIQEQLVVRAASVFKCEFTPTLLHNLAPINIEPARVKDICTKLCNPLASGKAIFQRRTREKWYPKLTAAGNSSSSVDEETFWFREPLLLKAVADTLLDSQVSHVMQKTDTLPIAGLRAKSWAVELLHPFLLHKYSRRMRMHSTRLHGGGGRAAQQEQENLARREKSSDFERGQERPSSVSSWIWS